MRGAFLQETKIFMCYTPRTLRVLRCCLIAIILTYALTGYAPAASAVSPRPMPRLEQVNGRTALFVDGAPYLMLGAQVGNSSAWPAMLPKVWPAMDALRVNTVEIPVYWEQLEPHPNQFDFSIVDTLLAQARVHHVRLVLLWFGTWKNGSAHYLPEWMKRRPDKYPNLIGSDGKYLDSPSPHSPDTLAQDIHAFTALMRHLKNTDPARTVIMMQVENEPGVWGGVRDYSPAAQRLFDAPVPAQLLTALGNTAAPGTDWHDAFGIDADEDFHAWSIARYIDQVAAAGKAVYPLPMYVNAALRDPLVPAHPPGYESGGATDNVIPIWKAAAPAIDLLAPDIYQNDSARYRRVLDLYARPDNTLFVPETASRPLNVRYLYVALGKGTIGFSPFGMDYVNLPALPIIPPDNIAAFSLAYQTLGPMAREIAQWNLDGRLHADGEETDQKSQVFPLGTWEATVTYGPGARSGTPSPTPAGNPQPEGRVLIAQLGDDQFIVTGAYCHVFFRPAGVNAGKPWQYIRVEEGQYNDGVFQPLRILNGDQTDFGLNFSASPEVLRVTLYTR